MAENPFEHYINTIEATPQWNWEQHDDEDEYDELWIAHAADNNGLSAMVRAAGHGYRVSLCIEQPIMKNDTPHSTTTIDIALAHESTQFLTAREAMLWVENYASTMLSSILRLPWQATPSPRLFVKCHNGHEQEITIENTQEYLAIGRHRANDIIIDHPLASRQHARIERLEEGFALRDLNSTNGTYINGLPVQGEYVLNDQDQIMIANTIIIFHDLNSTRQRLCS